MAYTVNFIEVETTGLEISPVAAVLAGLRANEAAISGTNTSRSLWSIHQRGSLKSCPSSRKCWQTPFALIVTPLTIKLPYKALNVTQFEVDGILWSFVFYDNGLAVNVLYTLEDAGKRAVGFKLSNGIEIPQEFEGKFKFSRQRSKLAGEIRGTYFNVKGEYLVS